MTVRLLTDYSIYKVNTIVTLDAATEAALVAQKVADTNLTGGTVYQALRQIDLLGSVDKAPHTMVAPLTIAINGSQRGAQTTLPVIADGTNVPVVTGADEWGSSFGYLNTAGVINLLSMWNDGVACRFSWSQQAVPAAADTVAPVFTAAQVNGSTLTLTYGEALAAIIPATSAYSIVGAGGTTQAPASVAVSGSVVTLSLGTPAVNGNTVTLSYTQPALSPIQDAAGNKSVSLSGVAVTNNTAAADVTAPVFTSAQVNGGSLTLTYGENLATPAPAASAFSVVGAGGTTQTPSAVSITGAVITLTLATAAVSGNTVTVSYTVPGTNPIRDAAGNASVALSGQAVTNNTSASGQQAETTAWLSRVASAGGTVSTATQNAVDAFVAGCKADSIFTLFRRLNLVCGDYAASQVPLVNTSGSSVETMTAMTSADYAETTGWTTDGTSKVVKTGYVPSEATGGLFAYVRTTQASDSNGRVPIGVQSASPAQSFRIAGNRGSLGASAPGNTAGVWGGNGANAGNQAAANTGLVAGFWHDARSASAANALLFNGNAQATSAPVDTPAAPSTFDLWVMALNNAGAYASGLAAGSYLAAYGVDTGMTTTQAAKLYTRMQTFQTALARNV